MHLNEKDVKILMSMYILNKTNKRYRIVTVIDELVKQARIKKVENF